MNLSRHYGFNDGEWNLRVNRGGRMFIFGMSLPLIAVSGFLDYEFAFSHRMDEDFDPLSQTKEIC